MSNYNPAMNFIPGPEAQQPGSQTHHQYPANTMSYPQPNPHIYQNPIPHPNTSPSPNIYPNPALMPALQSNPAMYPNQFQPNRTTTPSTQTMNFSPSMSAHSDMMPSPMGQVSNPTNIPHDFQAQATSPNIDISTKPSSSPINDAPVSSSHTNQTIVPVSNIPINLPTTQASPPKVLDSPFTSQTSSPTVQTNPLTDQTSPLTDQTSPLVSCSPPISQSPPTSLSSPQTMHSKSPTVQTSSPTTQEDPPTNQSDPITQPSSPTTQPSNPSTQTSSPTTQPSPPTTQPSSPTESKPSTSASPEQDQTLAGKLAQNVRRSKRKAASKDKYTVAISALTQPASKRKRSLPAKITYDDYEDDDEELDCPKEYLIENAYTDRLRFNNHVAKTVYKKDFDKFDSKAEFQKYLAGQQKWRWDVNNIVITLDTRVHNLCVNRNSGIAQNVQRYSSIPLNCKSDDVRRCERTSKELEKMIFRIEQTKEDMEERRKLLFDVDRKPSRGEIDFMDDIVKKVNNLKTAVEDYHSKVIDTLQNICKRFTTESVEAAEIRRQKRRKRENLKKKRKSQERSLEKKVIDVLLRLTSKEVAERILTGSDAQKISIAEMNDSELIKITNGSNDNDLLSLHTIMVREYFDEAASKLVKQKLASCA